MSHLFALQENIHQVPLISKQFLPSCDLHVQMHISLKKALRPEGAIPNSGFLNLWLHVYLNSDQLDPRLKFRFGPSHQIKKLGGCEVKITKGTVTVPLNLQNLSQKMWFDLHDRVSVEFVSGQEITVWWQCHMWLDTKWLSATAGLCSQHPNNEDGRHGCGAVSGWKTFTTLVTALRWLVRNDPALSLFRC